MLFIAPRYAESAGDGAYVNRLMSALLRKKGPVAVFTVKDGKFALIKPPCVLQDQAWVEEFSTNESRAMDFGILLRTFTHGQRDLD